jgi:hypothetical protein
MVMVESPHMEPHTHTHTHSRRERNSGGGRAGEREKGRGIVDGDQEERRRVVGKMEEWMKIVKERGGGGWKERKRKCRM